MDHEFLSNFFWYRPYDTVLVRRPTSVVWASRFKISVPRQTTEFMTSFFLKILAKLSKNSTDRPEPRNQNNVKYFWMILIYYAWTWLSFRFNEEEGWFASFQHVLDIYGFSKNQHHTTNFSFSYYIQDSICLIIVSPCQCFPTNWRIIRKIFDLIWYYFQLENVKEANNWSPFIPSLKLKSIWFFVTHKLWVTELFVKNTVIDVFIMWATYHYR